MDNVLYEVSVWKHVFEELYKKCPTLDFGTPLTVDNFCCICGGFLIYAYEDKDPNNKCRFCLKCWEMVKNLPQCPNREHGIQKLSKETMEKQLINKNPIDVLIICPYNCRNLYTIANLCEHHTKCRNRPKESRKDLHSNKVQSSDMYSQHSPVPKPNKNVATQNPPEDDQNNHPLIPKEALSTNE